jgi:hypothetical protein
MPVKTTTTITETQRIEVSWTGEDQSWVPTGASVQQLDGSALAAFDVSGALADHQVALAGQLDPSGTEPTALVPEPGAPAEAAEAAPEPAAVVDTPAVEAAPVEPAPVDVAPVVPDPAPVEAPPADPAPVADAPPAA